MKFEKLDLKKHSSHKVAELLYETDRDIFNFFYRNKSNTAQILEKLIKLGNNNWGHEHIYIVTQNELIIGALLYFMGNHHIIGELKFHFKNLNPFDAFRFLLIDLKDSLILSHLRKCDFYLAGVAVDEKGTIYVTDFVGHRIRKIIKMKWSKENHKQFDQSTKQRIKAVMIMSRRGGSLIHRLPLDVIFLLFNLIH